jgi:hypothetical protein
VRDRDVRDVTAHWDASLTLNEVVIRARRAFPHLEATSALALLAGVSRAKEAAERRHRQSGSRIRDPRACRV